MSLSSFFHPRRTTVCVLASLFLAVAGAAAWQDALSALKLNQETFERLVTGYVHSTASRGGIGMPGLGRGISEAYKSLGEAQRGTVVRELSLATKAFVMSPGFGKAYEAHIARAHNAVNHGIQVTDQTKALESAMKSGNADAMEDAANKMMRDNFRQQVQERLPEVAKFTQQQIEIMADVDAGLVDMSMPTTAAQKANVANAKKMLAEARKMSGSDLPKARETYKAALMLAAGLKDESAAAAGRDESARQEQQRNYNRYALKVVVKKGLEDFLGVARTVNFKAATVQKGDKTVFVNAADEKRGEMWKMLYRAGASGAGAAQAVAAAWLKEL